ncbi:MAG: hypothetical protein ACI4SJ_06100 [Candidatus Avispirillum sp.]
MKKFVLSILLLAVLSMAVISIFGCATSPKYTVHFMEQDLHYRSGKTVSIDVTEYVDIAGAEYNFYMDGESISPQSTEDDKYALVFTMPEHDVNITYDRTMAGLPEEE